MLRPYRGRLPVVDPSAYVDPSAQVIGDVEIGPDSSIWMTVVIRGDVNYIRIGRRSTMQDGTIVHVMHGTSILDYAGNYQRCRLDYMTGEEIE